MDKRQLLLLSAVSALIVSGFGAVNTFASSENGISNQIQKFQERFGITLTDEQKNQIQTKETEMGTQRATELAKWETMTLATWKQQQIEKINATTEEEFNKIKEQRVNMLKNGKGFGPGLSGERKEKPAE